MLLFTEAELKDISSMNVGKGDLGGDLLLYLGGIFNFGYSRDFVRGEADTEPGTDPEEWIPCRYGSGGAKNVGEVGVRGSGSGLSDGPASDEGGDNEMEIEEPLTAVFEGRGFSNCPLTLSSSRDPSRST